MTATRSAPPPAAGPAPTGPVARGDDPETPAAGEVILHLRDESLTLPVAASSYDRFRDWTLTDAFPDKGRIDYLNGRVEIDMSPESLYTHGNLKTELVWS